MSNVVLAGGVVRQEFIINATDLAANKAFEMICQTDGWVSELGVVPQVAIVTGGTVSVKTGPALATTIANLSAVVPNAAAIGAKVVTALTPAQRGDVTTKVSKGDRLSINLASFAGGGALNGYLLIREADTSPQAGFLTPSGA
jgi:hypothetical protein